MRKLAIILFCCAVCHASSPLYGQEEAKIQSGDIGLSFFIGTPINDEFYLGGLDTISRFYGTGAVYHPVAAFSIEPGIFIMSRNREYENKMTGVTDKNDYLYAGGTLGLYYNRNISGGLYLYLGPRCDYGRYERDTKNGDGSKSEEKEEDMSISAVVGFKYMIGRHLVLFADMGFGYFSSNEKNESYNTAGVKTSENETRTGSFALSRGILGVIFYL